MKGKVLRGNEEINEVLVKTESGEEIIVSCRSVNEEIRNEFEFVSEMHEDFKEDDRNAIIEGDSCSIYPDDTIEYEKESDGTFRLASLILSHDDHRRLSNETAIYRRH